MTRSLVTDLDALRRVCAPIGWAGGLDDAWLAELAADLKRLAEERSSYGLAAPQVGQAVRMVVLRGWPEPLINPVLTAAYGGLEVREEEYTGIRATRTAVARHARCKVTAQDLSGETRRYKLHGADARTAQALLDLLDGVLITDG